MTYYQILDVTATVLSLLGAVFAFLAWLKSKIALKETRDALRKAETKIRLILKCAERLLELPYAPRRKGLTRAEVAGVIGMYSAGRRFDAPGLAEIYRDGTFDAAQQGDRDYIEIEVPENEFLLFEKVVKEENDRKRGKTGK